MKYHARTFTWGKNSISKIGFAFLPSTSEKLEKQKNKNEVLVFKYWFLRHWILDGEGE